MANLLRTTITLPEELLKRAKITAVSEEKTLSELIRESLEERIGKLSPPSKEELLSLMGTIKPETPFFKDPSEYIRRLREESNEHRDLSS